MIGFLRFSQPNRRHALRSDWGAMARVGIGQINQREPFGSLGKSLPFGRRTPFRGRMCRKYRTIRPKIPSPLTLGLRGNMSINREPASPLPLQPEVEWQLLRLLSGSPGSLDTLTIYRVLADQMTLSALQLAEVHPDSGRSAWEWLVRRAKQRLRDDGMLYCTERGVWALTEKGRRRATLTSGDLGL